MLRITIHNEIQPSRLVIEGRLTKETAPELERCWREIPPPVRVELIDVTFVDETGRRLLQSMAAAGVELAASDLVMRSVVDEIQRGESRRSKTR